MCKYRYVWFGAKIITSEMGRGEKHGDVGEFGLY